LDEASYARIPSTIVVTMQMAEAALRERVHPREVSFKGAASPPWVGQGTPRDLPNLYDQLLLAIASHRVGNRPNRYEPRALKRRPTSQALLMIPRHHAKHLLAA